jgi:hypothetical protein
MITGGSRSADRRRMRGQHAGLVAFSNNVRGVGAHTGPTEHGTATSPRAGTQAQFPDANACLLAAEVQGLFRDAEALRLRVADQRQRERLRYGPIVFDARRKSSHRADEHIGDVSPDASPSPWLTPRRLPPGALKAHSRVHGERLHSIPSNLSRDASARTASVKHAQVDPAALARSAHTTEPVDLRRSLLLKLEKNVALVAELHALRSSHADERVKWEERSRELEFAVHRLQAELRLRDQGTSPAQPNRGDEPVCPRCVEGLASSLEEVRASHASSTPLAMNAAATDGARGYWQRQYIEAMKLLGRTEGQLRSATRRCSDLERRRECLAGRGLLHRGDSRATSFDDHLASRNTTFEINAPGTPVAQAVPTRRARQVHGALRQDDLSDIEDAPPT